MKKHKKAFIYALIDPFTNEIRYIGKTYNINLRYNGHLSDKADTYKTRWIKSLKEKNALPKIEVLEECDYEIWQEREIFWIDFYKNIQKSRLTNYTNGGEGWVNPSKELCEKRSENAKKRWQNKEFRENILKKMKNKKASLETRKKISESHKGKPPANKGKKASEEVRKRISEAHKGIKPSKETREKMSKASKGRISPRKGKPAYNRGISPSKETREKISRANKGRIPANKGKQSPLKGIPRPKEVGIKVSFSKKKKKLIKLLKKILLNKIQELDNMIN